MARARLGQLDRLGDRGVLGHPVEEQQLEQAELERGPHARLEPALRALVDDVVERQPALHGAEGELLGQRAVARAQLAGLAVQRPVRPGALGQHPPDHRVRGAAGGRDLDGGGPHER
jgi:hypothetical protein